MTSFSHRVRRLLGELSYAQRRSFELRTGVTITGPRDRPAPARRQIAALEAQLARTPVEEPDPAGA